MHAYLHSEETVKVLSKLIKKYKKLITEIVDESPIRILIRDPYSTVTKYRTLTNDTIGEGQYSISVGKDNRQVATFSLDMLQGCCGVCVSYGSHISHEFRNKGLGKVLNNFRIEIARLLQYGLLLCTNQSVNIPEVRILRANGWTKCTTFLNPRSGNVIDLQIINLTNEKETIFG